LNDAVYIWRGNGDNEGLQTYINGTGTNGGSRYIAATQGFFVLAKDNAQITMNNNVRVTETVYARSTNENTKNIFRIKISGNNKSDEAVIRFNKNATLEFDGKYDAYKLNALNRNVSTVGIYTKTSGDDEYAVNSVPLIQNELSIPLFMNIAVEGAYQLDFTQEYFEENYTILLEDLLTGAMFDVLESNSISVFASPLDDHRRFILHFLPVQKISNTTSVDENSDQTKISIYGNNNKIFISLNELSGEDQVNVFNLLGEEIFSSNINDLSSVFEISAESGIYVVVVKNNKFSVSEKIFIK